MASLLAKYFRRELTRVRAKPVRYWVGLLILTLLVFVFPIRTGLTRHLTILLIAASWLSTALIGRRLLWARTLCLLTLLIVVLVAVYPGRPYDVPALRTAYVGRLRAYVGVKYVWGGEDMLGVDCSGLVREGMIEALLLQGLKSANPAMLRDGVTIWWNRCNAVELGAGYRGRTAPVLTSENPLALDYDKLMPGDLAVMGDGEHVMAYAGDHAWIEADPRPEVGSKVVRLRFPGSEDPWLYIQANIVRWRELE